MTSQEKDLERKALALANALKWRLGSIALAMELIVNLSRIMRERRN